MARLQDAAQMHDVSWMKLVKSPGAEISRRSCPEIVRFRSCHWLASPKVLIHVAIALAG